MASIDSMREAEASNVGGGRDLEIAVRMAIQMLEQGGGMKVIVDSLKESTDAAMVIGNFLAQLVGQLAEQLQKEMDIDPSIFLAKGGWLEKILDYIEGELEMPEEFSDQIYTQVMEVIKAAASGAPPQGGPMETGAPAPMPEEEMMGGGLGG